MVFKKKHGTKKNLYWERGVPDIIKQNAYKKALNDDINERLLLENYLEFIEYKEIVEKKGNWELFKSVFNIPEPGKEGLAKNLHWMLRVNKLRRIPAHATEKRRYKVEDFEYIDWIHEKFMNRIKSAVNMDM